MTSADDAISPITINVTPNLSRLSESGSSTATPATDTISDAVPASSTASFQSDVLHSFGDQGGTLKRNIHGRNEVWSFFRVYNEKQFKTHAFCILCKKDINYGSTRCTSNLEKHILRHHKEQHKIIMSERASKRVCLDLTSDSKNQAKLSSFINPCPNYQDCLVKWMIDTYQPLSTVQQDSFRDMLASLNKKAPIVGHDKIRTLMSTKYYDSVNTITGILKNKSVSLTTDAWTSIAKEGFVTCTMHFIEQKTWTLHHFALGIFKKDGTSTAPEVVRYAEQHMANFGVAYSQLTCVVTDTESTMVAAGRLFKQKSLEEGGSTVWHGCVDHKLELVTKLAFKDIPDSLGTMAACRAIVAYFNSSSQATAKLKEKSKARLGVALTVIQDVCTRWWSTYSMCERLLRLRVVLTVMNLDGDLRLSLTEAQWNIVEDLTVLLNPFMIAQRLLEGEAYVTISLVPFMIYKIRSGLTIANTSEASSPQVRTISTLMLQKFCDEFGSGDEETVAFDHITEGVRRRAKGIPKLALMAMLLDPRTKSAVGIPDADCDAIWQYITHDAVELAMSLGRIAPTQPVVPQAQPLNRNRNLNRINNRGVGVGARYTGDVNAFLEELDDADDNNEVRNDDDLQELDDALIVDIEREGGDQEWDRNVATTLIAREVTSYKAANGIKLRDNTTGHFNCPLTWWKSHQYDYPYLAKMAMKLLAIPATSAPSERVFSTAGLTIAKDRSRLDSERANELVFLHDSIPELEKYYRAINSNDNV
jgi:hypothetical protein